RLFRVRLESAFMKIEFVPPCHHFPHAQRPREFGWLVLLPDRSNRVEESLDRMHVRAAYLGEPGIRERRIEVLAVATDAIVHRVVEVLFRPLADAGCRIRRDVGRIDSAEWRGDCESTRIRLAALGGVAGGAVAGIDQIASSLDGGISGALRPCRNGNRKR